MSKVTLTKWGNSVGVRIPAVVLKEANLALGVELDICAKDTGILVLKQKENQQDSWTQQFNAIADAEADELLLDHFNNFDDEEWVW